MIRCPSCGHHHGNQNKHWPSCNAIYYAETGGARRCACTGPTNEHQE